MTKITVCNYDSYQGDATNQRQSNDTPTTQEKEIKKEKKKEKVEKEKFDASENPPEKFLSPKFRKVWKDWIKYRRENGWTTKETYLKSSTRNLEKLAGDNTSIAIKIIQQSMDQGWQGLFALKNGKTYSPAGARGAKKSRFDDQVETTEITIRK